MLHWIGSWRAWRPDKTLCNVTFPRPFLIGNYAGGASYSARRHCIVTRQSLLFSRFQFLFLYFSKTFIAVNEYVCAWTFTFMCIFFSFIFLASNTESNQDKQKKISKALQVQKINNKKKVNKSVIMCHIFQAFIAHWHLCIDFLRSLLIYQNYGPQKNKTSIQKE